MRRFLVCWTHILGASNTEYVWALSEESAIGFIESRQGARNLVNVYVIK